eukprot:TRINITY_DN5225_c0_g1_i1.p1 TRINITY_DN5225_c0_g1~~TRINITY_DN5225_c0_g1_i1.p1  ORF type:complete len:183 (+),score=71.09 TRINITY_DN5225_c0_g1_i1:294-842(+)
MAGRGQGKKVNVNYTAIAEPKFLQQLRAKHGIKSKEDDHRDRIEAKRAKPALPSDLNDIPVNEEDQPQVVVLKKSHLSQEQAEALIRSGAGGAEGVLAAANVDDKHDKDGKHGKHGKHDKVQRDDANDGASSDQPSMRSKSTKVSTTLGGKRPPKHGKPGQKATKAKSLGKKNLSTLSFGDE